MKSPRPFDDYSKLRGGQIEREEAERALRHYILRRKRGMRVPDDLQDFILDGLQRQLDGGAEGWRVNKGRPKEDHAWINLWAWYCFHMDDRFRGGLTDDRYQRISKYLTQELISLRVEGTPGLSDTSIKRMVAAFRNKGFRRLPANPRPGDVWDTRELNVTQARLFCRGTLLLGEDESDKLAAEIVEHWEKGQK